ncbi:MAG: Flp pilus assembly complex ATPase component TadA [Lachnospiraceae bacterium]|nr:Flp pilus assembly complex ATPase component TadA [Lachnospiraceae bacterium]
MEKATTAYAEKPGTVRGITFPGETAGDREGTLLERLVGDYITQKQSQLLQLKKGQLSREDFLTGAAEHIRMTYGLSPKQQKQLLEEFGQYIFGYSRLSALIDDPEVSDIRVVGYDSIRVKKKGRRMNAGVSFSSEREYRQFIDYIATRNQVSISNLNAIQRFTDTESHPSFILRFTLSMPIVNTFAQPYLCIRKVPKDFPGMLPLVEAGMLDRQTAELLIGRFRSGSTLICGGNSSGKTTLLNALKETLPDDMSILVAQQADELTTMFHPDMMFLHSIPGTAESKVTYDLKNISIAGLTMDVDCFIIGEIKGEEALYLLNAACTGQICAGTIHSLSADRAADKLVDYAMYESRYSRNELMRMMDCFQTLVFMKDYRVEQIFFCKGWNEERKELDYERIL